MRMAHLNQHPRILAAAAEEIGQLCIMSIRELLRCKGHTIEDVNDPAVFSKIDVKLVDLTANQLKMKAAAHQILHCDK